MYGAILGDIIGSPYESDGGIKTKDFSLFTPLSRFTDDSVMTIAFLDGNSFEDVIRNAVSLGGDTDTIGAMAGSIAEAYYGVPEELKRECEARIPEDMRKVLVDFMSRRKV